MHDLDSFRNFVASDGFTGLYELPAAETILADDTALMLFGFRFLRQVLFGENSIALKNEAAEKRRERVQEKALQVEREGKDKRDREKLAAEQDGMYGAQES